MNLPARLILGLALGSTLALETGLQAQFAPVAPPAVGVLGYWSTDAGSVLQIDRCGESVCVVIRTISQKAPGVIDARNPDPALRNRPICRLAIGTGFRLVDPTHAVSGRIYDPESGNTYKSVMTSVGNELNLRGYIGFKALGRTQTWHRTIEEAATCVDTTKR